MARFMGFDIGSLNSCIALAQNNGLDVVENVRGKRQTPTCVAFDEYQRIFGGDAVDLNEANVKCTIENFKQFFGRRIFSQELDMIREDLPFDVNLFPDGQLQISVRYQDKTWTFLPEQILAMHLVNLKRIASEYCSSDVAAIVMSTPFFYSPKQRRALLDACQIAGLDCKLLLNDTTAVATYYTLFNPTIPAETEPSKHVVFVSVGHMYTQVAICALNRGRIKTLSTSYDSSLGGWHFTKVLYSHFAHMFHTEHGIKLEPDTYPAVHLMNECIKLKERLSMVAGPIPVKIDGFTDGISVNTTISRMQFDELSANLLNRLRNTLEDCLTKSGLQCKDLDAVEMVGGGFRVVAIRNLIRDVFGQQGRTSLNGTEVVAYGCALHAARLSPYQRVDNFPIIEDTDEVAKSYLSKTEIQSCIRVERELASIDEETNRALFARNKVESTIYSMLDESANWQIPLTKDERDQCVVSLNRYLSTVKKREIIPESRYAVMLKQLNEELQCLHSMAKSRRSRVDNLYSLSRIFKEYADSLLLFAARLNELVKSSTKASECHKALIEDKSLENLLHTIRDKLPGIQRTSDRWKNTIFGLKVFNEFFVGMDEIIEILNQDFDNSENLRSTVMENLTASKSQLLSAGLSHSPGQIAPRELLRNSPFARLPPISQYENSSIFPDFCNCWRIKYVLFRWGYQFLTPEFSRDSSQLKLIDLYKLIPDLKKNRYIARCLSDKFVSVSRAENPRMAKSQVKNDAWFKKMQTLVEDLNDLLHAVFNMSNVCERSEPTTFSFLNETIEEIWTTLARAEETNNSCTICLVKLQQGPFAIHLPLDVIQQWIDYHDHIKRVLIVITRALRNQESLFFDELLRIHSVVNRPSMFAKLSYSIPELEKLAQSINGAAEVVKQRCQEYIQTLTDNVPSPQR